MRIKGLALLAVGLGLPAVSACDDGPLAGGAGEPVALNVSTKAIFVEDRRSLTITAYLTDNRGSRVAIPVTATSSDETIVKVDSVKYVPEFTETRVHATAGTTFKVAKLVLSAGGFSDTVTVRVTPVEEPDSYEPASDDPDNPPPLSLPIDLPGTVSEGDRDDFYLLDVTAATTLSVVLNWDGDADLDFIIWKWPSQFRASDLVDASMATGNHPEQGEVELAPGKYILHINNFTDPPGAEAPWATYHLSITPAPASSGQ